MYSLSWSLITLSRPLESNDRKLTEQKPDLSVGATFL